MTDREKLIKLLDAFSTPITLNGERLMDWTLPMAGLRKALADYLLANGVTFANDINVSSWIPVSERLPEIGDRCLCNVKSFAFPGSFYQTILKYDKYGFVEGCIYTDDVTHWMLLPEPPKEEK